MKIKRIISLFIVFLLIFSLACCTAETEQESFQNSSEDLSQQISQSSDADISQNSSENSEESSSTPENSETQQTSSDYESENDEDDDSWYKTFEEITKKHRIPAYMKPYTVIIYDADSKPTIIKGGELTIEEVKNMEVDITDVFTWDVLITPNTKVEYDLHGACQNIYYLIPGTESSYSLDPDTRLSSDDG